MTSHVCIDAVTYAFPETQMTVRQLAAAGQLESDPALLAARRSAIWLSSRFAIGTPAATGC